MKITFVMTNANMSGGTRVIATQAKELIARGHEVTVVSMPPATPSLRRRVSAFKNGKGWLKKPELEESFFDGSGVPHVVLPRFGPVTDGDVPDGDAVIATWWQTAEWVAALSPCKGAKAFFIQHYEIWGGDPVEVDAAWRTPLHKIVISKWLADLARDKFGDDDVSHVPNSVDRQLFDAPPRGMQAQASVGMLYSATHFKGCDVSLKAIEAARKVMPEIQLVAFGQKEASPRRPLPAGTRYTINPSQTGIRDIYAQCDVWLCGSRSEGFHLPPLEAMACRCPVVSTRVGGPMDTIEEGRNGFLVDVEDDAALAEKMIKVLKLSDAAWREMSDAAYATAGRYTWQDAAVLMERALEKAIGRQRGAKMKVAAGAK